MSKLIRVPRVMDMTGLAKSTVWAWVKDGRLPSPTKLSKRVSVWKESDIQKWIDDQVPTAVR